MEENHPPETLSRTELEDFSRQLLNEVKKELESFRHQLLGVMITEQEAFRVTLLAEVKALWRKQQGETTRPDVPSSAVSTKPERESSPQQAEAPSPPASQQAQTKQADLPEPPRTNRRPQRKRMEVIYRDRPALVTPFSAASDIRENLSASQNPTASEVHSPLGDVVGAPAPPSLSPAEIERICRAFIRLIEAPTEEPGERKKR